MKSIKEDIFNISIEEEGIFEEDGLLAFYEALFTTGGKSKEQIFKKDASLSDEKIQNILDYYKMVDGLKVIVSKVEGKLNIIDSLHENDKNKLIEAMYLLEQNDDYSIYIDSHDKFVKDVREKTYIPKRYLKKNDIRIIKKITDMDMLMKIGE